MFLLSFSMGGLSALDITWNNPQLFRKAGIFSGSLWWRTNNTGTAEDDNSRIMHSIIRAGEKREGLQFWFQASTKDENRDRNKNGIIDSIDDTLDLIKELKELGYSDDEVLYEEIKDGQHNFHTWSKIFPSFLKWAFPVKN
ncbi:esterase family protein [Antarcticibacterium sp. 1MA-6-2]|uniref:alpha/beta hydrolase n=1 Tax=Antarcticibacterium sp. 1MA-6-2 TaxID=2908210 RepID=UPI0021063E94|nr:alpha/beta hydrolase-fold protein [Antarcticibacterium sp. 1MA-6-2]